MTEEYLRVTSFSDLYGRNVYPLQKGTRQFFKFVDGWLEVLSLSPAYIGMQLAADYK